jgi:hypothetical protein
MLKIYFITAARTYEILKVRSEVITGNWSNARWVRKGKGVI